MAYDKNEWLLDISGDGIETINADGNGTAVFFGENRGLIIERRIAGAVTGTNPTLLITIEASVDGTNSFVEIGRFPSATTTDYLVDQQGTMPARISVIVPDGKPYLRAVKDVGGTNPVFTSVSLVCTPIRQAVAPGYAV